MTKRTCSIEGCGKIHRAKGYCSNHYQQFSNPAAKKPRNDPAARFWAKVDKSGECWNWTAQKGLYGHGLFKVEGVRVGAHRYSWTLANGEIPESAKSLLA
jgi:hypothetical protein